MNKLVRLERWLCLAGLWVAAVLLGALVLLSGLNVFGRIFGHPIGGSYELSGFLGALIAALAILVFIIVMNELTARGIINISGG